MGVWIDTDFGFDDIAAILVVRHSPLVIDGVSLVFGNSPLAQVIRNAGGARAAFGWDFPIHAGRALPVLGPLETAQSILGETGIPTSGRTLPDAPLPDTAPAFDALCAWLEKTPPRAAFWRSARCPISQRLRLPGPSLPHASMISSGWAAA